MITNHEYIIASLEELDAFAENEFLAHLPPKQDGATLISLEGDLGAGKTAFTKAVARSFGIDEHVSSPTFIIAKSYAIPSTHHEGADEMRTRPEFHEIVHIDAYRMEDPSEASVLRLPEMMQDAQKLILIEWPGQLGENLPKPDMTLSFRFIDETTRSITWIA